MQHGCSRATGLDFTEPHPVEPSPSSLCPAYICPVCKLEVVDELGRALVFSNVDATGGLERRVVATGEVTSEMSADRMCWVRGIPCCADEGKLGGIVIEPVMGKK